jgi:hypothetical protein
MIYLTVLILGLVLAALVALAWRSLPLAERWFAAAAVGFTAFLLFGKLGSWGQVAPTWAYLVPSAILVPMGMVLLIRARGSSGVRLAALGIGTLLASLPALTILLYAYAMAH